MAHHLAAPSRHCPAPGRPAALVQAVVEAIARGESDDEFGVLGAVSNQRVRLLATARSMTTRRPGEGRKQWLTGSSACTLDDTNQASWSCI